MACELGSRTGWRGRAAWLGRDSDDRGAAGEERRGGAGVRGRDGPDVRCAAADHRPRRHPGGCGRSTRAITRTPARRDARVSSPVSPATRAPTAETRGVSAARSVDTVSGPSGPTAGQDDGPACRRTGSRVRGHGGSTCRSALRRCPPHRPCRLDLRHVGSRLPAQAPRGSAGSLSEPKGAISRGRRSRRGQHSMTRAGSRRRRSRRRWSDGRRPGASPRRAWPPSWPQLTARGVAPWAR